jgi:hypothetical protein
MSKKEDLKKNIDNDIDNDIDNNDIVSDDNDDGRIVLEDDNKIEIDDQKIDEDTIYFRFNTSTHRMEGKHSLKRDTIFNGKLNEENEEEDMYSSNSEYFSNNGIPVKKGTIFDMESHNFHDMEDQRLLKKNIYDLLKKNTNIEFQSNRRKPNKHFFNEYYEMLLKELGNKYSKSEIFVELSYYFTDHIFNIYKLLYPKHATNIIKELKDKGYLNELDNMNFV